MALLPFTVPYLKTKAKLSLGQLIQHEHLRVGVQVVPVYAACKSICVRGCSYSSIKVFFDA